MCRQIQTDAKGTAGLLPAFEDVMEPLGPGIRVESAHLQVRIDRVTGFRREHDHLSADDIGNDQRLPVRREGQRPEAVRDRDREPARGSRASQSLTVPSLLTVAKVVPSGETEMPQILPV